MKNFNANCTKFSTMMNSAAGKAPATEKKSGVMLFIRKKTVLALLGIGMLLIGTSSCSRNMSSGCGAWPAIKQNKNQYRSDTWPLKIKSDVQYANYNGYN